MNKLFAPLLLIVQIAGFALLWQKIPANDGTTPLQATEQVRQTSSQSGSGFSADILAEATIPELVSSEGKLICSRDEECPEGLFCDQGRCERIGSQYGSQCDLYTEKYGLSVCGPFPCNEGRCRSCDAFNRCPPSMVCNQGKCAIRME